MAQKPFAKDEMISLDGKETVRVESGPWRNQYGPNYLVEQADGDFVYVVKHRLARRPPVHGDLGRIQSMRSDEPHPYSPHTWVYMDADVVLLKDRLGDYEPFIGYERARVIDTWEAV